MDILIIDDNKDMAEQFSVTLSNAGYDVSIITTPEQILTVDLCAYHVVVVDYMVPDVYFGGAEEIIDYVKEDCCHDNIVMVTSAHIDRAQQHGLPVLLKPVDNDDLVAAVDSLASRHVPLDKVASG